jgi:flagellar hook assembly protein FlgD
VAIYDLQGRRVRTLFDEERPAGPAEAEWDGLDDRGSRAASGVYLVRLQTAGKGDYLKVTLVK